MELVLIEWVDSYASSGWQEVSSIEPEVLVCRSVGWVIRETDSTLVVAPHLTDEDGDAAPTQANGLMTIPVCAIVSRRPLACVEPAA